MRISRSTGFISGVLLVALGIWGAAVPFTGPYFHYAFGTTSTWHYTTNRLLLDILPGGLVVVGGALLITTGHRINGIVASWMAIIGGAWFAIGPAFSRIWEHGPGPIGAPLYGSTRQALELIGYFYGLGALVVALAAFAIGRFVTRPTADMAGPAAAAVQPEATAMQPQAIATQSEPTTKPARAPRVRRASGARRTTAKSRRAAAEEHASAPASSDGSAPNSVGNPRRRRASRRGPGSDS